MTAAASEPIESGVPPDPRDRPPLARYANYFEIGHNAFEFLLDCGQVEPQSGEVRLLDRLVVGPVHVKLLATLLNQSLEQYERLHGEIPDLAAAAAEPDLALTNPLEFERLAIDARRRPAPVRAGFASESPSTER